MNNLKTKTLVDERFEIIERLGAGGMGVVYKAHQIGLERVVALKVMLPHLLDDANCLARFELEAQALASLKHRNISLFYAYGVWHGRAPYIAMEYLDKGDLAQLLLDNGNRISWRRTISIAKQIAEGMSHAHQAGVLHRDLKPSNVFLLESEDNEEHVKVADFGLAKFVDDVGAPRQKLTKTGHAVGSPLYMSPEQLKGLPATPACDMYALGCIMFQCLFGHPPYDALTMPELLALHLDSQSPVPKPEQARDVPPKVLGILETALAREPADRYATMQQFAQALNDAQKATEHLKDSTSGFAPPRKERSDSQKHIRITAWSVALLAVSTMLLMVAFNGFFLSALASLVALPRSKAAMEAEISLGTAFEHMNAANQAAHFYDNAISLGARLNNPRRSAQIALAEANMFKRAGNNERQQLALGAAISDLNKVFDNSFAAETPAAQKEFLLPFMLALGEWHPAQAIDGKKIQFVVPRLHDYCLSDEETAWSALYLPFARHVEGQPLAVDQSCMHVAYYMLREGKTSKFRQHNVEFLQRGLPHPIERSTASRQSLVNDALVAAKGHHSADALAPLAALSINYCVNDQSDGSAMDLRKVLYAVQDISDGLDERTHCFTVFSALFNWISTRPADEQIEFFRRALANEDARAYWDASVYDFRKLCEQQLAYVYEQNGRPRDALAMYQHGLHIASTQWVDRVRIQTFAYCEDVKLKIAELQMKLGDYSSAYQGFHAIFKNTKRGGEQRLARWGAVNCINKLKGLDAAYDEYSAKTVIQKAEALQLLGRTQDAVNLVEPIVDAQKTPPGVKMSCSAAIARYYGALGAKEKCLKTFAYAASTVSKFPAVGAVTWASVHSAYADALASFGDTEGARQQFATALQDAGQIKIPDSKYGWQCFVWRHQGVAALLAGNKGEAIRNFQAAVASYEARHSMAADYREDAAAVALAMNDLDAASKELWHADVYTDGVYDEYECSYWTWRAKVELEKGNRRLALDLARRAERAWSINEQMDAAFSFFPLRVEAKKMLAELQR